MSLATKSLWRLIQNMDYLWGKVMTSHYCLNYSIIDWIRSLVISHKNISIGWNPLLLSFTLFQNWMAGKVGNDKKIQIGVYPWIGASKNYTLSQNTLAQIQKHHINKLSNVKSLSTQVESRMT